MPNDTELVRGGIVPSDFKAYFITCVSIPSSPFTWKMEFGTGSEADLQNGLDFITGETDSILCHFK